jgi:cytochrome P450
MVAADCSNSLCMGRGLALLEAKLAVAQIFSQFELDLVPGQTISFIISVTAMMAKGIKMAPKRRK